MLEQYWFYRKRNGRVVSIELAHLETGFFPEIVYEFIEKHRVALILNGVRICPYRGLPFGATEAFDNKKRFAGNDGAFFDRVFNPDERDQEYMNESDYLRVKWGGILNDFHRNAYVHWFLYIKNYPRFARRFLGYILPYKMKEYKDLGGDPERPGSDPHGQEIRNIEQTMKTLEKEGRPEESIPAEFWKCLEERHVVPEAAIREAMEETLKWMTEWRYGKAAKEERLEEMWRVVGEKLVVQDAAPEEKAEPPAEKTEMSVKSESEPKKERKGRKERELPDTEIISAKIKLLPGNDNGAMWITTKQAAGRSGKAEGTLRNCRNKESEIPRDSGRLGVDKMGRVYYISEVGNAHYYLKTVDVDSPEYRKFYKDCVIK